jgi:hypothetical protein
MNGLPWRPPQGEERIEIVKFETIAESRGELRVNQNTGCVYLSFCWLL